MKNRDVAFTGILLVVSLTLFLVCIMEFETKNFNITSIPEGLYFMIVTMTTVGYGDYFPLGTKGQLTIISAIALGVIFEGMFLIAWARFIKMDSSQENAFLLIQRCNTKKQMQEDVCHLLETYRKEQLIKRDLAMKGLPESEAANEIFELQKQRMVCM